MNLTLYHSVYSHGSRSLKAFLSYCEMQYELKDFCQKDFSEDELYQLHPLGQCPILKVNGTAMAQAGSIMRYICDSNPSKCEGIFPSMKLQQHWDPKIAAKQRTELLVKRAEIDKWISWTINKLRPAFLTIYDVYS